jgi:predicted DNA-binding transcriptional regulator AlpA
MERLLNTNESAKQTGLSIRTFERMRTSGLGPRFIKCGRAVRYRESDLESWLAAQTVSSTSEARHD